MLMAINERNTRAKSLPGTASRSSSFANFMVARPKPPGRGSPACTKKSLLAQGRHKNARPASFYAGAQALPLLDGMSWSTRSRHRNEVNLQRTCENPPRRHVRSCCLESFVQGPLFGVLSLTSGVLKSQEKK